jgi:CHAT domain-containing protein
MRFGPLPASGREAEEVARLWSDDASRTASLFTGPAATELAFKRLAPGQRVIHVATHGFFADGRCPSILGPDERSVGGSAGDAVDSPLLLSGLALAGANRRQQAGDTSGEDGVLTAEELASLDLSGVEWMVLSACETAVGEVQAGEGVLGLRRALETAGAGTLIMSLWRVEDDATRTWMRDLYAERLGGASTAEAVRDASLQAIASRREAGQSTHPFYWGAFVAAGAWR